MPPRPHARASICRPVPQEARGALSAPGTLKPFPSDAKAVRVPLMSRFFKSAAFPILIVVVLAFFAQKLISTSDQKAPPTYGQFIDQLHERGVIKSVDLRTKDNVVAVTQTDGKKYETGFTDQGSADLSRQLQQAKSVGN